MSGLFRAAPSTLEAGNAVSTTLPLTFACWFAPWLPNAGFNSLISISFNGTTSTNQNAWLLGVNVSGSPKVMALTANLASSGLATSLNGLAPNSPSWGHAAATFAASGASRTAWLNGIPGTANGSPITPASINRTNLGACYVGGALAQSWKGQIAEAAIWGVELSATEIAALARGVPPPKIRPGNLLLYAPLRTGFPDAARANVLANTQVILRSATPRLITAPALAIGAQAAALTGTVAESASATDAVSASGLFAAALTDALTAADTVAASGQATATLAEAANAADAVLLGGSLFSVSIEETAGTDGATDAILFPGGSVFTVAVIEEQIAIDDTLGFPPVDVITSCDAGIAAIDVIGGCEGEADAEAYGLGLYGAGLYGGGGPVPPVVFAPDSEAYLSRISVIGAQTCQ